MKSLPTLIFLHLPKTGGVTLSHILVRHFHPSCVFHVRNPEHPRGPRFSKQTGTVDDFAAMPSEERNRFRCILGHIDYGVHALIDFPYLYVTLLRDPVERLLSHYAQFRRMIDAGGIEARKPATLEDFLLEHPALCNHQTRFLSGLHGFRDHQVGEALERAREHLHHPSTLAGTTERFDETLLVLARRMGWRDVRYQRWNVSDPSLSVFAVGSETRALLAAWGDLDRMLHEDADRRLSAEIERLGPSFADELARFRRRNRPSPAARLYDWWQRRATRARSGIPLGNRP